MGEMPTVRQGMLRDMKPIRLTSHAEEKFAILQGHGCVVTREQVLETLRHPATIIEGYRGRRIAQGSLHANHLLNVVFVEAETELIVVTFYPVRRARYEGAV